MSRLTSGLSRLVSPLRGGLLIALAATSGLGIATALRNTGAALGAAFVYFAVAEFAVRFILAKYGPEPYLVSGNSAALLLPEGLEVPGKIVEVREGGGATYEVSDPILLTHGRAAATLTLYAAIAAAGAVWSFHRRDVG